MTEAASVIPFDRVRLALIADWLAVGVAVSLPWSTSATAILIVVWLLALLPTLHVAIIRRELETAAGGFPVLLWCLAAIGMMWSDVSWAERIDGLGGFHRLLIIPLLLAQFRRSPNGVWVLYGFLASTLGVLLLSWALTLIPGLTWRGKQIGVPVKDYVYQSAAFLVCAFTLLELSFDASRARNWRMAGMLLALAALFFLNIAFVATSRTVLLVALVLVVLLGWRQLGWKGLVICGLLAVVAGLALWLVSPYLRERVANSFTEIQDYRATNAVNSTALHFEFLKKSMLIVSMAPIVGHGTGSIGDQFRRATVGTSGAASVAPVNPHNQTFAVAIQLGLLGAVILVAMWAAHFWFFFANGAIVWIGTVVVVENVISSFFSSHLFDFSNGWLYVFGVGVVGGMVLRHNKLAPAASPAAE